MWTTVADKRVEYAEDIYSITEQTNGRSLELLCPTKRIRSRGDTLNCPTISIRLEAEFDGVISLEFTHWAGAQRRGPNFELYPDGKPHCSALVDHNPEEGRRLTSGSLSALVSPDPHAFTIRFHPTDEPWQTVTALRDRSVGFAYAPPPGNQKEVGDMTKFKHYMFTQTDLDVGESIHGLGERFGGFNKVGQIIEVWNEDGGTSSEQAYKNIPFFLSSNGYGVFMDTPELVDLEIGSERCCRTQISVESQRLKWYIIHGGSPKNTLSKYSILTGKAPLPPAWSFGLWLSTSFTTEYDEATVTHFLTEMKKREIPLEVFHYDCFWMRAYHWCDFVFSAEHFPNPKASIARLKEAKLLNKVCVWINPYIGQASPVFQHCAEKGYLVKRPNGDVWQWDMWQSGMGLVDFTNPEACVWYKEQLEHLFNTGVDTLKTDFGERIPWEDVVWFDKSMDPKRMHNFYAFLYNKLVFEALQERFDNPSEPSGGPKEKASTEAALFARSATTGTQRFPLCWGGDCESTPLALAESIRGGLGIGLSSFSFWSCDIGGFEGSPEPWIYKRWVAFGLFCSHSRLHGSNSYRVPWLIQDDQSEEGATAVLRKFVRLKRRLMPYIYAQAKKSAAHGWPTSLRAMCLEFADDPTSWFLDRQFMLGSQILVAPVFTEHGEVQFYLPEGQWTSLDDHKVVQGPCWRKEHHGFGSLPVYVRERTVLLLGQEQKREEGEGFGYDWLAGGGEVKLYHTKEGDSADLVNACGADVGRLEVDWDGNLRGMHGLKGDWSIQSVPTGLVERESTSH